MAVHGTANYRCVEDGQPRVSEDQGMVVVPGRVLVVFVSVVGRVGAPVGFNVSLTFGEYHLFFERCFGRPFCYWVND